MDAGAGKIGAVALNNGQLTTQWTQDQTTLSFTTLIGPQDHRVLIGTNIPIKFFKQLQNYSTEQVIWRDAAPGKELASSDQFPKMSAGILVTPGYVGLKYFFTTNGHIIALPVTPTAEPDRADTKRVPWRTRMGIPFRASASPGGARASSPAQHTPATHRSGAAGTAVGAAPAFTAARASRQKPA